MYANFHARKKPVPSSHLVLLSFSVRTRTGQAPTSLPVPSWLHIPVRIRPTSSPLFSYAAAGLQTIRKNTAAASPPHSAAVAAAFPTRSWKFSSSSFHVAQIHYCMQCVTLRHFPPFLSSSKACNRNLQPTKNSPFHPLFRFLEVKHFVW